MEGTILANSENLEGKLSSVIGRDGKDGYSIFTGTSPIGVGTPNILLHPDAVNANGRKLKVGDYVLVDTYLYKYVDNRAGGCYVELVADLKGDKGDKGEKGDTKLGVLSVSKSGEIVTANDVSPVEHDLKVNVATKNLLVYPYYDFTAKGNPVTVNGVTFTDNGDGSITVNGTATAQTYFAIRKTDIKLQKGKTYTLSGFPSSSYTTSTAYINVRNSTYEQHIKNTGTATSVTFTAEYTDYYSQIYINSGVTLNNVVIKPQLEEGITATAFAPYIADLTTVKVTRTGKNLLPPSSLAASGTTNGVAYTNNCDGSITINGTATAIPYITVAGNFYLPKGRYTLSQQGDDIAPAYIYITGATAYSPVYNNSSRVVTSTGGNCQVYITAKQGDTIENKTVKIMLEEGEAKTEYEAPKGQTATPNADGTVKGLTSVSPNMKVFADKGVNIDLTYYADTKTYIDNKFAELQVALTSLGGD